MNFWKLKIKRNCSGSVNMRSDQEMFDDCELARLAPILRIYSWQPSCISLGYSQKAEKLLDCAAATKLGWEIVRRPTGGGLVFHNEAEVSYSLVMALDHPLLPRGLIPAYIKISEAVVGGLSQLGIVAQIPNKLSVLNFKSKPTLCFSQLLEYEIMVQGKKIVGSAQKRGRRTLLQQGSIFVRRTPKEVFSTLKEPVNYCDAVSVEEVLGREVGFGEMSDALIYGFKKNFNFKF